MDSIPESTSGMVLTETGQMVDVKSVFPHFPKRYIYRPEKRGEKEKQEKRVREDRARLQARNLEIQKIGPEDPTSAIVAREQIVSLGENHSSGSNWVHLLENFESLVRCDNFSEMANQFIVLPPAYKRFPEEVIIGNPEFPNTFSRLRLVDLENQDGSDIAIVIPNLQRDRMALHYSGERPPNVEPGSPVVIDTMHIRSDEMLRRYNGERLMLDEQGKPADLVKIPLEGNTRMWIVNQIPEKATTAEPQLSQ